MDQINLDNRLLSWIKSHSHRFNYETCTAVEHQLNKINLKTIAYQKLLDF